MPLRARTRTRTRKLSSKDRLGLALFAAVIGVVTVLTTLTLVLETRSSAGPCAEVSIAQRTYPVRHTVVLVDKTDPLTPAQQQALHARLSSLKGEVAEGERLSIFYIDAEQGLSPVVFSRCNPGDATSANPLYENPQMIQTTYNAFFGAPLDGVIQELGRGGGAPRSPILEAIGSLASELTVPGDWPADARAPERRLVLVSDLLQHMPPDYSQYGVSAPLDYPAFAQSAYGQQRRPSLSGVDVEILYLLRAGAGGLAQGPEHLSFWNALFTDAGAHGLTVHRLGSTRADDLTAQSPASR